MSKMERSDLFNGINVNTCSTCGAPEPAQLPGWPAPLPHLVIRDGKLCRMCAGLAKAKVEALDVIHGKTD